MPWKNNEALNEWYPVENSAASVPTESDARRNQRVEAENMATGLRHDYDAETDPKMRVLLFAAWECAFKLWQSLT